MSWLLDRIARFQHLRKGAEKPSAEISVDVDEVIDGLEIEERHRKVMRQIVQELLGASRHEEECAAALDLSHGILGIYVALQGLGAELSRSEELHRAIGTRNALAVTLACEIEKNGTREVHLALRDVEAWGKLRKTKKETCVEKAADGEERKPGTLAGQSNVAPVAPVLPFRRKREPAMANGTSAERATVGIRPVLSRILALNINQHQGPRNEGWYVPEKRGEALYVLRSAAGEHLAEWKSEGLLLRRIGDVEAKENGTFDVKAGKNEYDVFALDVEAMRRKFGEEYDWVPRTFDKTRNSQAKDYTVKVLATRTALSTAKETPAGGQPNVPSLCPICAKGMERRKNSKSTFLACVDKKCGFRWRMRGDGTPVPPRPCPACGDAVYQNHRRRLKHADGRPACEEKAA